MTKKRERRRMGWSDARTRKNFVILPGSPMSASFRAAMDAGLLSPRTAHLLPTERQPTPRAEPSWARWVETARKEVERLLTTFGRRVAKRMVARRVELDRKWGKRSEGRARRVVDLRAIRAAFRPLVG